MKKLILIAMFATSFKSYAVSPFWVGLGSTTRNFSTAQKESSGSTVKFALNPTLLIGTTLPFFFSGLYFSPGIGYAKYSTKDSTTRNEIILQYHLSQMLLPNFLLQYGFSNTITKIGGKGGTVVLNNGSSTSTFYIPSETKTSYMASMDIGGELVFTSSLGSRLQFSIDRFLSSKRRRVSHMLTFNYYF